MSYLTKPKPQDEAIKRLNVACTISMLWVGVFSALPIMIFRPLRPEPHGTAEDRAAASVQYDQVWNRYLVYSCLVFLGLLVAILLFATWQQRRIHRAFRT